MTLEEFIKALDYNEHSAQTIISRKGCRNKDLPRVDGKYPIDEKKLANLFKELSKKRQVKQSYEMSFDDIYQKYKGFIGKNKLKMLKKSPYFPKKHRLMLVSCSRDMALWHRNDIEEYFSKMQESLIEHSFIENPKPAKARKIIGHMADSIFFCTGRNWRLGETIITRLIHAREV